MKILRLDLTAFGPFTGHSLDFSTGDAGFHLVFGPNEAGKSSALRALRQLLYGIPTRSEDNFLHPYPSLRIGARLQAADGRLVECIRRKGNRNTLRGPDDRQLLEESVLQSMLGGVDEETFTRRYGLGYEDLVEGGRAIAAGGGDLGRSLFAAASGAADLGAVQRGLAEEAKELFKPSAKLPLINEALGRLRAKRSEIKECLLPTARWREHDEALKQAAAEKAEVEQDARAAGERRALLDRIRQALPIIAQRDELAARLAEGDLSSAPRLADDFAEQRREASTQLQLSRHELDEAAAELKQIDEQAAAAAPPAAVLAHAEAITQLHARLAVHQKAQTDRALLSGRRDDALAAAAETLRQVGRCDLELEQADQLRLTEDQRVRIQTLGNEKAKLVDRVETSAQQLQRNAIRQARLQQQLAELPPSGSPQPLRDAIDQVQAAGPVESQLDKTEQEIEAAREEVDRRLARLAPWTGTPAELVRLPLPSEETVERFERRLTRADQEIEATRVRINQAADEAAALDEQIERLRLSQDVPTEYDLLHARAERDRLWAALRGEWSEDRRDVDGAEYETAVQQADEIADRLRRESQQVAEKAQLLARRSQLKQRVAQWNQTQRQQAAEKNQLQQDWRKAWQPAGVEPQTPREMLNWLQQAEKLTQAAAALATIESQAQRLQRETARHRDRLADHLADPSAPTETLDQLLARAKAQFARMESTSARRDSLTEKQAALATEAADLSHAAQTAGTALAQWGRAWREATEPLALRDDAEPAEAGALLERIKSLLDKLHEAEGLKKRINDIDRDAAAFEADVRRAGAAVDPGAAEASIEQAAAGLVDQLQVARRLEEQQKQIRERRRTQQTKHDAASRRSQQAAALLGELCKEAGCQSSDELPTAEQRSQRRRELERELRIKDDFLLELAAGRPLEQFIIEAQQQQPEAVQQELSELDARLAVLDERRETLNQDIGRHRNERQQMDGNARAAAAREEAEQLLARIRRDAGRFARLQVAATVLENAITRYREKHQGPVLQRAGELFAELTLEFFDGLRADYNDQGRPVLVGVRSGGRGTVHVDGMSAGTCDQLYLALRLASIEADLQQRDPLPLVVDDILIMFDDDRATAALKCLARLSQQTQVILFTHHEHLVALAEKCLDDDVLKTHPLDSRGGMERSPAADSLTL